MIHMSKSGPQRSFQGVFVAFILYIMGMHAFSSSRQLTVDHLTIWLYDQKDSKKFDFHKTCLRKPQDKIFRRKRLSTGANFVHVYIEIWDKGILKFNKFSM